VEDSTNVVGSWGFERLGRKVPGFGVQLRVLGDMKRRCQGGCGKGVKGGKGGQSDKVKSPRKA